MTPAFNVPAEYFYVLAAGLSIDFGIDARYELAVNQYGARVRQAVREVEQALVNVIVRGNQAGIKVSQAFLDKFAKMEPDKVKQAIIDEVVEGEDVSHANCHPAGASEASECRDLLCG